VTNGEGATGVLLLDPAVQLARLPTRIGNGTSAAYYSLPPDYRLGPWDCCFYFDHKLAAEQGLELGPVPRQYEAIPQAWYWLPGLAIPSSAWERKSAMPEWPSLIDVPIISRAVVEFHRDGYWPDPEAVEVPLYPLCLNAVAQQSA
jgi:hypothetical protein